MKKTIVIFSHFVENDNRYLQYTHLHAKQLAKLGYKVIVIAPKSIKTIKDVFKKCQIKNIDNVLVINNKRIPLAGLLSKSKINLNGLFYYFSIKKIVKKIMKKNNLIWIDAHNFRCEGYAAYLLKKKYNNFKVTITFHGSDLEAEINHKNGINRLLKVSSIINYYVCVSDKLYNKFKNIGVNNVSTINNGIQTYNSSTKLLKKEKEIITVADLIDSKNVDIVIDSLNELLKKNNDCKLKIVGNGILRNELEEKVVRLNLQENVKFLGEIPNKEVFEELSKADCFVLPSSPEGFGIVYAEAMYNYCVTIGTKGEGIDGFIEHGKNGFLVNPNVEEIVNLITDIYDNKYNIDYIRENAHQSAKELTWEKNAKEYVELLIDRSN